MTSVVWETGHESGFESRSCAQRFVERIGKVIAPDLNFEIYDGPGS